MKAIIKIDVPDFQIGQEVNIHFKDSMVAKGVVEEENSLSSVSTEKIGHWIDNGRDGYIQYYCSCCCDSKSETSKKLNYCPNCGTKMVESQERSEE